MDRPRPLEIAVAVTEEPIFIPAPEIIEWATQLFIESGSELYNEDHKHLNFATIGALWTNVQNSRAGRRVVGQCEMGLPPAGKWMRGRMERQLLDWFGEVPDFVLTFDATYCATCSDAEFMALVEHELYHAGQERDEFGGLKFRKDGRPALAIKGHDVEEFVGVVRRYGANASGVRALVDAANRPPEIADIRIAQACGTCRLRAA